MIYQVKQKCVTCQKVQKFLNQFPSLQIIEGNKVKCKLTGHELPLRLPELQQYTSGKKYMRITNIESSFNYSQFEPHIVPSTKNAHQLFCKLTLRHLNKIPQHVLRHVSGKRYKRALKKFEECQKQNIPYVPACLKQKKKRDISTDNKKHHKKEEFWEPDSSAAEEDSDDSMSDLYPAEMFGRNPSTGGEDEPNDFLAHTGNAEVESDDENNDEEKMETDDQTHHKRKMKQKPSFQKKFKRRHQKPKNSKKIICTKSDVK
ncbi:surfeit locus protein 2 [Protopterus annectens]|uniref:surfeit locus protein 2 n=1 Tax=Protopterus annectens TaxID=7888 RepID=UPI001CFA4DB3|nr:surfeit locus protein 2 [Protopterus annectens]